MVVLPLLFMLCISLFGMLFDATDYDAFGHGSISANPAYFSGDNEGWFDAGGRHIAYPNMTLVDGLEEGEIRHVTNFGFEWIWCNHTVEPTLPWMDVYNMPQNEFPLYNTPDGAMDTTDAIFGFFVGGQLGFLALLFILMLVASIAGIHILGSGISDVSVGTIIKCGAYIGLFVVCSFISYDIIVNDIPFGSVLYFVLTAIYTMGVIGSGVM